MPDFAVMPQFAKALTKAAPTQRTAAAMQKAVTGGDAPATPPAQTPSKPASDKGSDQPVQFIALLMAQIAQPVEQPAEQPLQPQTASSTTQQPAVQLAVAPADQAPVQNAQAPVEQAVTSIAPQIQIMTAQPVAAVAVNTTVAQNTAVATDTTAASKVVTSAKVTSQTTTNPMVTTATDTTVQPLTNQVSPQPLPDSATIQKAIAPQTTPSNTPLAPAPTSQQATSTPDNIQDSTKPNPVVIAAQTPAIPSLKNDNTGSANLPDSAPQASKKSIQDVYGTVKTVSPTVAQKPILAEALAAQMATKGGTKQPETTKPDQLFEVISAAPRQLNLGSATYLYNTQLVTNTAPQLPNTATVVPPQSPPPQSNSNPAMYLRLVSDQLVDGIRSAGGTDRTLTMNLNPPELGRVHLRMQDDGGRITAVLKVENAVTRADIEQALPSIVRSLEQSGINIRRLDVIPADPVVQDGSSGRQGTFQGEMPNQRDAQGQSARQTSPSAAGTWQNVQPAAASSAPISVVSDSAINIYM